MLPHTGAALLTVAAEAHATAASTSRMSSRSIWDYDLYADPGNEQDPTSTSTESTR